MIFYTFTPYDVSNQTAKRSYISDYFFTEKQSDYYVLVQDYLGNMSNGTHYKTKSETIDPSDSSDSSDSSDPHVSKSQQGGPMHAKQVWKDIKSVVVKSLIATLRWTTKMEADQVIPGTTYEIFGYDIVLDNELNPYLCEINETPNMGLEVNYHSDYHGLGAAIEQQDYTYKTELMDATLAVADVEPRYSMNDLNEIKLEILDIIRTFFKCSKFEISVFWITFTILVVYYCCDTFSYFIFLLMSFLRTISSKSNLNSSTNLFYSSLLYNSYYICSLSSVF